MSPGYIFPVFNSTEHEILIAHKVHKTNLLKIKMCLVIKPSPTVKRLKFQTLLAF